MSDGPLDVARRGYARWVAGDIDGMLELATSDFEFVPAIAASVEGGSIEGHDDFRRFFADLGETWETFRISADDFREAGGRVMSIGRLTAKGRGSELELDQPIYSVLWFRGDRIARMQSFLDESEARAALEESEGDL
jgi:ketosteroid isomerase-like protein